MARSTTLVMLVVVQCLVACSAGATSPEPRAASPTAASPSTAAATPPATFVQSPSPPGATPLPGSSDPPAAATAAPSPAASEPGSSPTQAGAVFDQPWATAVLTDVTSGETFRIADLAASGKVVFVETMAIWCTNCRSQQLAAKSAFEQGLNPARVEWVVIDVETSESPDALARYKDANGFPFRYAISDPSVSRALVDSFGDVILNPPPVNVVVMGTDGRITHLLGHHDAAGLVAIATEHGA